MEELLLKIRALHVTNKEIIERVEKLSQVLSYNYHVKTKQPGVANELVLVEAVSTVEVSDIIKEFKFVGRLRTDVWDVFNDKPNWECETWADLKRLNNDLCAIVDKFELLDKNNAKAKNELAKYLHNFEVIQTGLGQVEEKTLSEKSRKQELQKRISEINSMLAGLKKDGVKFEPDLPMPGNFTGTSILNGKQKAQLAGWYGQGWKLLYKASRDGWQGADFHSRCDNKGETVAVGRSTGGYIFGGYLGASWNSSGVHFSCTKASLFTLVNPHSIAPTRLSVSSSSTAAYGHLDYGPIFGGRDLALTTKEGGDYTESRTSLPSSYQDSTGKGRTLFAGTENFQLSEVEVFGKQ